MKWTVLVDNRTNDPVLETEHGLSIFLETDRHRILLDTGASDMLIRNAERLGISTSSPKMLKESIFLTISVMNWPSIPMACCLLAVLTVDWKTSLLPHLFP